MRVLIAAAVCLAVWQLGVLPAAACRCAGPDPGPRALRVADVALMGSVTEIERYPSGSPRRFRVRVEEGFAGAPGAAEWVHMRNTSCAIRWLGEGEEWLVFATRDDEGRLWTRQCTGTVMLRAAPGPDGVAPARSRRVERILRSLRRVRPR